MDWSGIKNRWQAAFGQKSPVEMDMPIERRRELESTISLFTKMNRLDQLLEIIREEREKYNEPWLQQAEQSLVRQLNIQESVESAELVDLEEITYDGYSPLSEMSGEEWPEEPTTAVVPQEAAPDKVSRQPNLAQAEIDLSFRKETSRESTQPAATRLDAPECPRINTSSGVSNTLLDDLFEAELAPSQAEEKQEKPVLLIRRPHFRPTPVQSKFSLDCDDGDELHEASVQSDDPNSLKKVTTEDEGPWASVAAEAPDNTTEPVVLSAEEEPEQVAEADAITIEFDPDDVIELIEQIDEEDDPSAWREELDPFMWDTVVDEVKEVSAPSTRLGREARARQVAAELIAKHHWPHQALPVLTEIFNRKAYGPAKVALDTLMTRGLTLPTLILAVHVRAIWHNSPAYWVCFNKTGDVADDSQNLLSWPAAINVLNAFSELPSVEELEWFLEEQLEYWRNRRDLRRCFRSFRLYLWYRTADLKETLPPDEWRNFERLPYASWN